MKKQILGLLASIAALFGMSGCLEVEQTLSLKKDGSGTITEEIVMGAQLVAMLEGGLGGAGGENPFEDMHDVEKYKKQAATYGEGVKYSKMEKIARNGGKGVKVTYTFEDINKVKYSPGSAMDDLNKQGEKGEKETPITFAYAGGVLTVTMPDPPKEEDGGAVAAAPADAAAEAMIMQMFKDMKIGARLIIEPGIANSDATHQDKDGKAITLMEINFNEILKNPDGIKALKEIDKGSRAQMEKALKGVKGVKFETKEKVVVKLK